MRLSESGIEISGGRLRRLPHRFNQKWLEVSVTINRCKSAPGSGYAIAADCRYPFLSRILLERDGGIRRETRCQQVNIVDPYESFGILMMGHPMKTCEQECVY